MAIGDPMPPGVSVVNGPGGPTDKPSYSIQRGANVGRFARDILQRQFYRKFSILASVRPDQLGSGYIFSLMDLPRHSKIVLGVRLIDSPPFSIIRLEVLNVHYRMNHMVNFTVPRFAGQWRQFAFSVTEREIIFYFQCVKYQTFQLQNSLLGMFVRSTTAIYLGRSGWREDSEDTAFGVSSTRKRTVIFKTADFYYLKRCLFKGWRLM